MNIALFLGAGASVPYDKPTIEELRGILLERLHEHREFLSSCSDTERALAAIQDIVKFSQTDGGRWWNRSRTNEDVEALQKLERKIHNEIHQIYTWSYSSDKDASVIFSSLFNFIQDQGSEIAVFTTNYDRSVEEYCGKAERKLRYVDGFSDDNGKFVWTGRIARSNKNDGTHEVLLYKLHGSLDWAVHSKNGWIRTNVELSYASIPNFKRDLMIYPTQVKNNSEYDDIFAQIFRAFSTELDSQNVCIVVGFSFRDEQIRKRFAEFIKAGKKLILVDPNSGADFQEIILKEFPRDEQERLKHNIHHIQEELGVDTVDSIVSQIRDLVHASVD